MMSKVTKNSPKDAYEELSPGQRRRRQQRDKARAEKRRAARKNAATSDTSGYAGPAPASTGENDSRSASEGKDSRSPKSKKRRGKRKPGSDGQNRRDHKGRRRSVEQSRSRGQGSQRDEARGSGFQSDRAKGSGFQGDGSKRSQEGSSKREGSRRQARVGAHPGDEAQRFETQPVETQPAPTKRRTPAQVAAISEELDRPTFSELGVPRDIVEILEASGRSHAFAIQAATLADSMDGRDICGRAPTGSGKTLAFGIPAVAHAEAAEPHRPNVLILTPTRELAAQIRDELEPLARARRVSVATFYGGTSVGKDIKRLSRGVDIAVCTPGRLEDLMGQGQMDLSEVGLVILDEADRMADMGFLPVVTKILDQTPENRQTLLFSATLDGDVDVLVKRYQKDPVRHEVEVPALAQGEVSHHFWAATPQERRRVINDVLKRSGQTIVFCRTKRGADRVARNLNKDGFRAASIHGDRSQRQREKALSKFGDGEIQVLVATDVAARGIHVDGVDAVLHFDVAGDDKDYIHRSGRTGRAGADGIVITLIRPADEKKAKGLLRDLKRSESIRKPQLSVLD